MMNFAGKLSQLKAKAAPFTDAFRDAYGEGREEWSRLYREERKVDNKSESAPRWDEMTGSYPMGKRVGELYQDLRKVDKSKGIEATKSVVRDDLGLGAKRGAIPRAGQLAGTFAADLTQDVTRNFYWLLNAAQATGNVITEKALAAANPKLYGKRDLYYPNSTKRINIKDRDKIPVEYRNQGSNLFKKGISADPDGNLQQRNYAPGDLASLLIPTGFAINTGLGLTSLTGGAEGFKAAVPSEEDPTKTDNVIGEIAAKYFLGRTGSLLPYSEFKEVRPDVSPEEYRKYSAFKYNNNMDLNIFDDGQVSAPAGFLKYANDGIFGPEVQFLGRSLPVTTGILPFGFALAGGALGVKTKRPIKGGLLGGLAGVAVGQVAGNLIEQERRRRNTIDNQLDNPQY